MRRYITEFVGTFLLVVVIGLVVLAESEMAPLAIGAAVAAVVYAGFHISGGQYNPAVTLAVLVRGVLPAKEVAPYCAAQVLGAALGAVTASFLVPDGARPGLIFSGDGVVAALVAEFVFTFALLWVILHVATAPKNVGNSFYGVAIGAVVVAGILAVGGISGGVVNPAVAVALALMGVLSWSSIWIYLLAQLAAAVVAGRLFVYCVATSTPQEPATPDAAAGKHALASSVPGAGGR